MISNKKGLGAIITTLLMVGVIFAMFAIIYPWAFSSLSLSQSQANTWFKSQEREAKERIAIEMVVFRNDTNTTTLYIDLYVRNVGEIDIDIADIYINGTVQATVDPSLPERIYLKVKGVDNVKKFTMPYAWDNDELYRIKVVTERGGTDIFEANSPATSPGG